MFAATRAGVMAQKQSTRYRYWRVVLISNNGDSQYVTLTETELRASLGGADLTTPSTVVTASSYLSGYGPERTVDGIFTNISAWVSNPGSVTNQWLQYDLGTQIEVAQVALYSNNDETARNPKDIRIEASNDGINFVVKGTFLNQTAWGAEFKTFNV